MDRFDTSSSFSNNLLPSGLFKGGLFTYILLSLLIIAILYFVYILYFKKSEYIGSTEININNYDIIEPPQHQNDNQTDEVYQDNQVEPDNQVDVNE